jgi:hypothetical protein
MHLAVFTTLSNPRHNGFGGVICHKRSTYGLQQVDARLPRAQAKGVHSTPPMRLNRSALAP